MKSFCHFASPDEVAIGWDQRIDSHWLIKLLGHHVRTRLLHLFDEYGYALINVSYLLLKLLQSLCKICKHLVFV